MRHVNFPLSIFALASGLACSNYGDGRSVDLAQNTGQHSLITTYGAFDLAAQVLPEFKNAPQRRDTGETSPKIVQFTGPIQADWKQALKERHLEVRGYIPRDAYIISMDATQAEELSRQPFVRAITEQPGLLKVHPKLVQQTGDGAGMPIESPDQDLLVEMADVADRTKIADAVAEEGGSVYPSRFPSKLLRIRAQPQLAVTLAGMPEVTAVDPAPYMRLFNDTSYGVIQSGSAHHAPVWSHGLVGTGQLVGVSDTGVDPHSCFFVGNKILQYQNYASRNDYDGAGHGTHVAGSIAGDIKGNKVYDRYDGMAPAARLVVQDIADGEDLTGIPDDLADLFSGAYNLGVRIHSNSWGGQDNSYDAMARSADAYVATHRDFLALFANGNDGAMGDGSVRSPSTAKSVLSVGAIVGAKPTTLAFFSSRGPTADGRTKPTLSAPGMDVVSAKNGAACDVVSMSGTSMATPTMAGGAALVRQYFTDGYYPSGKAVPTNAVRPSAALIKAVMIAGADNLATGATGRLPGFGQGYGRVDLAAALPFNEDDRRLVIHDDSTGLETGTHTSSTVDVAAGKTLKVALVWSDEPGIAGAGAALVNDLDLIVVAPDGSVYHGNVLKQGASDRNTTLRDHGNVEEIVIVQGAPAGRYQVIAWGNNVPLGPQPYAVAVLTY